MPYLRLAWQWVATHLALTALIFVTLTAGALYLKYRQMAQYQRATAFALDSAKAAADTTRNVNLKSFGDSVAGATRLAFQQEVVRDAIDKALRVVSASKTNIVIHVDTVRASGTGTGVTETADVRKDSFTVRQEPFTVTAAVALPRPPSKGSIKLGVVTDSIQLGVRLQCGEPVRGVRPASILVTTPKWMNAKIEGAQTTPQACNPITVHGGSLSRWFLVPTFLGGLYIGSRITK